MSADRIVVLTGGVGGAKLVLGLACAMAADHVTAIVNTGDDFRHLGLWISPDVDTLLYTLSGRSDEQRGWGRAGETWNFMTALRSLGGEDWFNLGDADLALHVWRAAQMDSGATLSRCTADIAARWEIATRIVPMSDGPIATMLHTDEGALPFQRYFVERRCAPRVRQVKFDGAPSALPAPGVIEAISSAKAILIAPSNPYLSIDPILAVPGIADALRTSSAPVVAVSPLVGGEAVKGPTRKLMDELGVAATPAAIATHYEGVIDALLIDDRDRQAPPPTLKHAYADTLMRTLEDRVRVARAALALVETVR